MKLLTAAICTFNRADRLQNLIAALRVQECPIPFEILIVDNNSTDNTQEILTQSMKYDGPPLRVVSESVQGIVPARNRAIEESQNSDYLFFMDDDELPLPGLLKAAVDALDNENADCVGGRVENDFTSTPRPKWLEDNLLGFLAEVNYSDSAFWIKDETTPVWTANVAYKTDLFKNGLRFDKRYSRVGKQIGGGSDAIMFKTLLKTGAQIRYRPDMAVKHFVEDWRLHRSYFLKLHFKAGLRKSLWELIEYPQSFLGIPPFLIFQMAKHVTKFVKMVAIGSPWFVTTRDELYICNRNDRWMFSAMEEGIW